MIKAIFFDIDGTLRSFRDECIPPAVLNALGELRKKGILLFIATGRGKSQVGFLDELFDFDGIVAQNGQYCYTKDSVLRCQTMDDDDVGVLIACAKAGEFACIIEGANSMYLANPSEQVEQIVRMLDLPNALPIPENLDLRGIVTKAIVFVDKENESALLSRTKNSDLFRWHPNFVDMGFKGGGKDVGIDAFLKKFDIDISETMAFGDGENDLEMLQHVAIGIAMGNSSDLVKQSADYITDHVDEDGVVNALKHFGLL